MANAFNKNLKNIRIARNMTQQELADLVNVNRANISRWENDEVEIPLDMAYSISKALNLSFEDMVKEDLVKRKKEVKSKLNTELSDYIKLLRFKAKMSQDDAAKKLEISRATYNRWENKPDELDLGTIVKIGNAFNDDILIFFRDYATKCGNSN